MLKIKNFLIACLFLFPQYFFAQYTDVINSNRPGETMSAFSVGKSVIQAEAGLYGINEKHDTQNYEASGFGTDFTLRWGLFVEQLEFIADIQYQNEKFITPATSFKKSNLKQTYLGAKYLIYDPFKNYKGDVNIYSYNANKKFRWRQLIPAVSIFGGANFVLKDNPYAYNSNTLNYYSTKSGVSPKIMLITQNHFGSKWVLVSNIIADYIGTGNSGYGYILTLTRGFNSKWSGFVENQGYKSDLYSDAIFRGGAAYLLSRNMQIDASISKNLKNTPSLLYGGIGFSIRYDDNHKEELTRVGKVKKTKKKKNKDKITKEELEEQDRIKEEEDYQEKERLRKAKYE
nr:transporter [uncultured Flavobacterium sp.]